MLSQRKLFKSRIKIQIRTRTRARLSVRTKLAQRAVSTSIFILLVLFPSLPGMVFITETAVAFKTFLDKAPAISKDTAATAYLSEQQIEQYQNHDTTNNNSSGSNNVQLRVGYPDLTNTGSMFIKSGTIVSDLGGFFTNSGATTENGGDVYIMGDWGNSGTYTTDTGRVTFWGNSNQAIGGTTNSVIYDVVINNSAGVTMNTNLTVKNTLNLDAGELNLNSNTLSVTDTATTAITTEGGYIYSEQTNNSSKVAWTINSVTGAHVIPFGDSTGLVIPLTVNLTAGNIGIVTASTYPTPSNLLPLPVTPIAVGNILSLSAGLNNSANMAHRWWEIDKSGASGTATLTFTYPPAEIPVNGETTMNAQRYNSSNNKWDSPRSGQSQNTIAKTVTDPGVTAFGPFVLTLTTSVLPVEFIDFTAVAENGKVRLDWSTASELNSDYFTIQRGTDGVHFENLQQVKAAGTSTHLLNYTTYDDNPLMGQSYYRLKETDFNGAFSYAGIRTIEFFKSANLTVMAYPNPARSDFNLAITKSEEGKANILVIDPLGQVVFTNNYALSKGENTISFACSSWPRGAYHVRVTVDDADVIEKTIILN